MRNLKNRIRVTVGLVMKESIAFKNKLDPWNPISLELPLVGLIYKSRVPGAKTRDIVLGSYLPLRFPAQRTMNSLIKKSIYHSSGIRPFNIR